MIVKIQSVEKSSFVGRDGSPVNGYRVHYTFPCPAYVFMSDKADISDFKEGTKFDFQFDNKGKLLSHTKV